MSEVDAASQRAFFPGYLFGFGGRIGPKQYFIGLACAILALFGTFMLAASAMMPTGGGGGVALMAFPAFGLFLWMLTAVTVQRLRDADRHPALALAFVLGPILLLYPALELIESWGPLIMFLSLGILIWPGVMDVPAKDDGSHPNA